MNADMGSPRLTLYCVDLRKLSMIILRAVQGTVQWVGMPVISSEVKLTVSSCLFRSGLVYTTSLSVADRQYIVEEYTPYSLLSSNRPSPRLRIIHHHGSDKRRSGLLHSYADSAFMTSSYRRDRNVYIRHIFN